VRTRRVLRAAAGAAVAAAAIALAGSLIPRHAAADPGLGPTRSDLALVSAHLTAPGLSHILPHLVPTPPGALLTPLGDESLESVAKGMAPAEEQALAGRIIAASLHQRLIRVAIADIDGTRMALVKLQAGDKQTGAFSVSDLESDALAVLQVAAGAQRPFQEVDIWSVVPWVVDGARVQRPVFSASATAPALAAVGRGEQDPREALRRCGVVRYSPVFLDYALEQSNNTALDLPPWGFRDRPLREEWPDLLARAPLGELAVPASQLDEPVRVLAGMPPNGAGKMVALTIDDGPHPLITPLMLEILRKANVKATFFLVGEQVEQFPSLARALAAAGHEIGNHTYGHYRLVGLGPSEQWAQLEAMRQVVARITGNRVEWFRPPGGDADAALLQLAQRCGYSTVLWTHNTGDWERPAPSQIVARALQDLVPGSIILMHQDDLESAEALPGIIAGVRAKGLTLGRVSDLVSPGRVPPRRPSETPHLMQSGL